jgi:hypothetical protein
MRSLFRSWLRHLIGLSLVSGTLACEKINRIQSTKDFKILVAQSKSRICGDVGNLGAKVEVKSAPSSPSSHPPRCRFYNHTSRAG